MPPPPPYPTPLPGFPASIVIIVLPPPHPSPPRPGVSNRAMGVPVMICHLAECLMDRTLDCRWDAVTNDETFKLAALKEGVMRLGYVGDLRPLTFLSETVGSRGWVGGGGG